MFDFVAVGHLLPVQASWLNHAMFVFFFFINL